MSPEIPIYVTKIAERVPTYRGNYTLILDPPEPLSHDETLFKKYNIEQKFTFPNARSEGVLYCQQLNKAIKNNNETCVPTLLKKIEEFAITPIEKRSESEQWAHMAVQLPGDWGVLGENKTKLKKIITKLATGKVLEPMAGFHSYFDNSPNISEIIALDFCEEALERYDYPDRKRILYDLEKICNGEKFNFFEDEYFQTIGVFFGVNYLTNPIPVYKEFQRILSPNGKILIVGGTNSGYYDLNKKWFNPLETSADLQHSGFTTSTQPLALREKHQNTEYYLITGLKS